ncbi:transposase, IS4 family protein [Mycobacterium intracellulare subsp. yongonense 05-1390]|nr:transposase, IS4 family protein [Mycobacterium intracellulare subsp. yongonense 05-1390]ARR77809.1 transposase, IS4 family protein [Mycobacterium intracellulare subsp. yongonense]ARR82916.1 transposase, IS4 family protein [Mycobacterium intracellulare subsp. yongonense]
MSHRFTPESAVFDDDNLVSCAGLVPVMTLAAQTGLVEMLAEKVHIAETRIKSGAANPAPKLGHADRGDVRRRGQHRRC